MSTELDIARADATNELASAFLKAAGDVMAAHSGDPQGISIVCAGFAMALREIGKNIDPTVPMVVRKMLEKTG